MIQAILGNLGHQIHTARDGQSALDLLKLRSRVGETDPAVVGLTGTYHNLLRMWADALPQKP